MTQKLLFDLNEIWTCNYTPHNPFWDWLMWFVITLLLVITTIYAIKII